MSWVVRMCYRPRIGDTLYLASFPNAPVLKMEISKERKVTQGRFGSSKRRIAVKQQQQQYGVSDRGKTICNSQVLEAALNNPYTTLK